MRLLSPTVIKFRDHAVSCEVTFSWNSAMITDHMITDHMITDHMITDAALHSS